MVGVNIRNSDIKQKITQIIGNNCEQGYKGKVQSSLRLHNRGYRGRPDE